MFFKDLPATKKCQLYIGEEKFKDLAHSVQSDVVLVSALYPFSPTLTYLCEVRLKQCLSLLDTLKVYNLVRVYKRRQFGLKAFFPFFIVFVGPGFCYYDPQWNFVYIHSR